MQRTELLTCALATVVHAHMQLTHPPPFNATNNPHRTTPADSYLQYPYDCCGPGAHWSYPCRGYHTLLGTPDGSPTASWPAGSLQSWTISGSGNHYGGSCQVGFSTDGGKVFRVAASYEGNCPHRNAGNGPQGQGFEFTVPRDVGEGTAVFAWVWYNREGEGNMNCAAVNITGPEEGSGYGGASPTTTSTESSSGASKTPSPPQQTYDTANGCTCTCASPVDIEACDCTCPITLESSHERNSHATRHHHAKRAPPASVAFDSRPEMFIADDGNGCLTPRATAELKYPDPGPDVVVGDGEYPLELPRGECGRVGVQA